MFDEVGVRTSWQKQSVNATLKLTDLEFLEQSAFMERCHGDLISVCTVTG